MSVFISGSYNLQDIKHDLLKIMKPYDGYMYNNVETETVTRLFNSFLGDLKTAHRIYAFTQECSDKENAVTFDISIQIHRDRTPKKLKIHVGRLNYNVKETGWQEIVLPGEYSFV
jgi:hypothetical protein